MTQPKSTERPAEWPAPTDEILERAVEVTLAALTAAGKPDKNGTVPFSRHYDVDGNYAGATFATRLKTRPTPWPSKPSLRARGLVTYRATLLKNSTCRAAPHGASVCRSSLRTSRRGSARKHGHG